MPHLRAESPVVEELDHEVKFVLPAAAAAPARALLAGLCRPEEPHARSRVGTIYFDDRALSSAGEKQASDYRKTKVRLRWYDGGGEVHLEVKRRLGSRREKLRLALPIEGAMLEAGGLAAAERCGVAETLRRLGQAASADLAPALRLLYDRERFVDPGSRRRVSLDTNLAVVERASWCAVEPIDHLSSAGLDVAIVETKGAGRELPPAFRALEALGARRGSFSKYTACLLHGSD